MKLLNIASLTFLCLWLTACQATSLTVSQTVSQTAGQTLPESTSAFEETGSTLIQANGQTATINGSGATVSGSTVTITSGGTYTLSGILEDGQVIVNSASGSHVSLILKNFNISSSKSVPIYGLSGQLTLHMAEGSSNTVSDTSGETAEDPDAAVFAKDDLIIDGNGSLTITSANLGGIHCKDSLFINSGTLHITSAKDAVKGKDSVTVSDGDITLVTPQDGIVSDNDTDALKGTVLIQDGVFQITTGGGHENTVSEEISSKAIKAVTSLTIEGGEFIIDSSDDAFHSNKDVTIRNGTITLSTGDDGVHANEALLVEGGTINIITSYEGLEGNTVTIQGGEITLTATDDGINAASDVVGDDHLIQITGGTVTIAVSGDGLDSNGNLSIEGGTIIIQGPANNGNASLDYDKSGSITGGLVFATGSARMIQGFGSSSTQKSLIMYYSGTQPAGTLVTLTSSDGTTIISQTPATEFSAVIISAPQLEAGKTYTLTTGEATSEITISETSQTTESGSKPTGMGGGMGGGKPAQDGAARPSGEAGSGRGGQAKPERGAFNGQSDKEPPAQDMAPPQETEAVE